MAIDCNACYNGYTLDHSSKDFNSADAELDRIVDLGIGNYYQAFGTVRAEYPDAFMKCSKCHGTGKLEEE